MRIGTDIVLVSRIKNPEAFAKKILSEKELSLYREASNKEEWLAGRFAAKEAFTKAVGKGLALAPLNEIEVLYDENGAPYIMYKKHIYQASISHDGGYATSVVLYE